MAEARFRTGLLAFFPVTFPSFISLWGLGGRRPSAAIRRLVSSSDFFVLMPIEIISPPSKKWPAANRCIYCGRSDGRLTSEHIIPFALCGNQEIPNATCDLCKDITSGFEHKCLRKMPLFFNYRVRGGFKTRHKNEWPDSLTMEFIKQDGSKFYENFSPKDYPELLLLPKPTLPGILLRRPPDAKVPIDWFVAISIEHQIQLAGKMHSGKFETKSFFRMIAKIGYSYALATTPHAELSTYRILLQDFILGNTTDTFHLVGAQNELDPPTYEILHEIDVQEWGANGIEYLVAIVRLFSDRGSPTYCAVIGERPLPEQRKSWSGVVELPPQ